MIQSPDLLRLSLALLGAWSMDDIDQLKSSLASPLDGFLLTVHRSYSPNASKTLPLPCDQAGEFFMAQELVLASRCDLPIIKVTRWCASIQNQMDRIKQFCPALVLWFPPGTPMAAETLKSLSAVENAVVANPGVVRVVGSIEELANVLFYLTRREDLPQLNEACFKQNPIVTP